MQPKSFADYAASLKTVERKHAELNKTIEFKKNLFAQNDDQPTSEDLEQQLLGQLRELQTNNEADKAFTEQQRENSFAGKLGLEPGDLGHFQINNTASLVSSGSRAVGSILTAPLDGVSMLEEANIPEPVMAAWANKQRMVETDEDMALLNQSPEMTAAEAKRLETEGNVSPKRKTYLERLETADQSRELASGVADFFDITSTVDQRGRAKFSRDLAEDSESGLEKLKNAWESTKDGELLDASTAFVSGAAELLVNGGEAIMDNKVAMVEYLTEMIPDLTIGAYSKTLLTVHNVGYGIEAYRKGIQKYQAENNGAHPDADTKRHMALNAFGAAAAASFGDVSLLRAGKGLGKLDKIKKVDDDGVPVKGPGFTKRAGAVAAKGTGGTVTEGLSEGYETYAEGEASLTPASAGEIYEGATIGAGAGGTISTGASALKETGEALALKGEAVRKEVSDSKEQDAAFGKAQETGDIGPLTDPAQVKTYHPGKAAAALANRIRSDEVDEAATEESKKKLDTLIKEQTARVAEKEALLADTSPESIQKKEEEIAAFKTKLAGLPETDTENRETLESTISGVEEELADLQDKRTVQRRKKSLDQEKEHLATVKEASRFLAAEVSGDPAELETQVTQSESAETPEARAAASSKVITLMMESPEALSQREAERLANSNTSGFSQPQRRYLREYSNNQIKREALKNLKNVSKGIYEGDGEYKGIDEYTADMSRAVRTGDKAEARENLQGLGRFRDLHTSKAAAVTQAHTLAKESGKPAYITRGEDANAGWTAHATKPAGYTRKDGRGLAVYPGSTDLAKSIPIEAEALASTYKQLEAQLGLMEDTAGMDTAGATEAPAMETPQAPDAPVAPETAPTPEVSQEADTQAEAEAEPAPEVPADPTTPKPETKAEEPPVEQDTPVTQETDVAAEGEPAPEKAQEKRLTGRLRVLKDAVTVEGHLKTEAFKAANLVRAYFTQKAEGKNSASSHPLVRVPDFISTWLKDKQLARRFVAAAKKNDAGFTPEQGELFSLFTRKVREWGEGLDAKVQVKGLDPAYRHRDFIQFLRNDLTEDGKPKPLADGETVLDENVKTALVAAAFTWMMENSGGAGYNNKAQINIILNRDTDTKISDEEFALLGTAGTRDKLAMLSMGKAAAEALGLRASEVAPLNTQAQLELSLGAHALDILVEAGLVERNQLESDLFTVGESQDKKSAGRVTHPFVRVKRNWNGEDNPLIEEAAEIREVGKAAGSVLHSLFGIEQQKVAPTFEAQSFEQETTKHTDQKVPPVQAEILEVVNPRPNQLRLDMRKMRGVLDESVSLAIAGYEALVGRYVHDTRRVVVEAKNDGILRDFENLNDFELLLEQAEEGLSRPFYFQPTVQRQQRVGLKQNLVNPQTSKFHRHNVSMAAWQTELDPASPDSPEFQQFRAAVAQALGVKTDRLLGESYQPDLTALMETDLMKEAVAAIQRGQKLPEGKKLPPEDQQAILDAVEGRENFHSLDGLVNWATYKTAERNGTTFTTDIMYEVDGVSSGPALSHTLLGVIHGKLGELFGFYPDNSNYENPAQWREEAGNQDLYEVVARYVTAGVQNIVNASGSLANSVNSIYYFTGPLREPEGNVTSKGRNLVKQPLTAMVFGSGIEKGITDMTEAFVESLYERLESIANTGDKAEMALALKHINTLLPPKHRVDTQMSFEAAMALRLNNTQVVSISGRFKNTVGRAVGDTLNTRFATFIEARKELNKAAQVSWEIYNTAYEYRREQKMAEKLAAEDVPVRDNKKPWQDLTAADEAEIREELKYLEPIVHTPMSKLDSLDSGLRMAKISREIAQEKDDAPYTGETKFNRPKGKSYTGLRTRAIKTKEIDPGVATVIMAVHSVESAIAAYTYKSFEALHIHDAEGFALKDVIKGAQSLNENTFRVLSEYSLPMELSDALGRANTGLAQFIESLPKAERAAFANSLRPIQARIEGQKVPDNNMTGTTSLAAIQNLNKSLAASAKEQELSKLTFLKSTGRVNQYGQEGGSYEVTAEDKAGLDVRITELGSEAETSTTTDTIPDISGPAKVGDTPWGKLGDALAPSDPVLVEALESGRVTTVKQLIPLLAQRIKATSASQANSQFALGLLREIRKVVNLDMPINYITPLTPEGPVSKKVGRAKGWYRLDENGEAINIKSPDFVASGITPELLLHELTHGALAQVVAREQDRKKANPKYESQALKAVQDMERVLKAAKEYVKENGLTQHEMAVSNIQEFLAYGMTDPAFQTDVLNKIQLRTRTRGAGLASGMKAFIQGMVDIFFRDSTQSEKQRKESGMSILINNAGLLFEAAGDPEATNADLLLNQEVGDPGTFSTDQVFTGLGNLPHGERLEPGYETHLRGVLRSVVDVAYGPFDAVKSWAESTAAVTAEDVFLKALNTGETPFTSAAKAHLALNNQEAFVLETAEAAMRESLGRSIIVRNEMRKLFRQVKEAVEPKDFYNGDWSKVTPEDRRKAEATHAFIFTMEENGDGTSDFLSRFAAIGLAYKPLQLKLKTLYPVREVGSFRGLNFAQKLNLLYEKAMQAISHLWTRTYATQRADSRLMALAQRVAGIEGRKKATLMRQRDNVQNLLEKTASRIGDTAREKVEAVGRSAFFKENKNAFVRASGSLASAAAGERVELILEGIKRTRDGKFKGKLGVPASLIVEAKGATDSTKEFHRLLQAGNVHEQTRKHIKDDTAELLRSSFVEKPTKEELKALNHAFLTTDMAALLDHFTLAEMEQLMSSPAALKAAIADFESQLTGDYAGYYKDSARVLGYYMVTQNATRPHLMMNAHNIAFLGGTPDKGKVTQADGDAAIKVIDPLVSLHALAYSSENHIKVAREVFRRELNRGTGNGVEVMLMLHQKLQQEAQETLFEGDPVSMVKGYTKATYDPYVEVVAATEKEGRELVRAGYTKKDRQVGKDPSDPDQATRHLYVIRDGGMNTHVSAIVSLTGKGRMGAAVHSGITSVTEDGIHAGNARTNRDLAKAQEARIRRMLKSPGDFDPRKATGTHLVPVLNRAGESVNYRYLMDADTRHDLLDPEYRMDQVLGTTAASAFDKGGTEQQNRTAIDALYRQYKEEYGNRPEGYVEFSATSSDASIRESYRLLPEDTKKAIRETWGQNAMLVRNDLLDMTFGYRKFEVSEAVGQIFEQYLEKQLSPKALLRIRRSSDVWQALVREIKDIWVIKNLVTFLGNETSNITSLIWFGVPLQDIVKNHVVGLVGAMNYRRDRKELFKLERLVELGLPGNAPDGVQQRIVELKDAMSRNPVRELIEAGMFQSIIEDIDTSEDQYSYKARLARKVDEKTQWMPEWMKTTGKTLYMAHDTPMYRVLNQATQLSDFVARYTLHEHMTNRKDRPMDRDASLQLAVDAFVNYDIPTHRTIQALNDYGIIWFTKYYIRIQKVLLHLYKEHPARALGVLALGNFLPLWGNIMESGFWGRLGNNPLDVGALKYPGSLDEIIALKAAMYPFN